MNIKKHIPNFLTLCNLLCGCLAIIIALRSSFEGNSVSQDYLPVAYLICASLMFDFLDGFIARLLKVTSPIGKELDSLADMVAFGLLPGVIMYILILGKGYEDRLDYGWVALLFLTIPAFSALRLAKFNVDERQSHDFYGVPTPANAILIASLPMIMMYDQFGIAQDIFTVPVLVGVTIVSSLLLVTPIRLMAFKFKDYTWGNNKFKYIHLALFVIFVVTLKFYAIPLTIVVYILLSLLRNLLEKNEVQS